jgi:hypothetical protein
MILVNQRFCEICGSFEIYQHFWDQGWPPEQILLIGSEISGLKIFADRIGPELEKNVIGSEIGFEILLSDRTSSDLNIVRKNA